MRLQESAILLLLVIFPLQLGSQSIADSSRHETVEEARNSAVLAKEQNSAMPWYERIRVRGYAQIRYNRLLETNSDLRCSQCDRSIGDNGGFFLRRGRLVISGDISDRVSFYVQPDYGADAAGSQNVLQLRDAYFDVWLGDSRTHRIRLGQSKVPFGFETLQSSSARLPLDRAEGLNSGVPGERDIGVYYMWSPTWAKRLFRVLGDSGLKGTGDYGVVAAGLINGQTINRPEANNSLHRVLRVSVPFEIMDGQIVEAGIQGFDGRFVPSSRTAGVSTLSEYLDRRVALSFTWYARPLGLVAEWNWGKGPEYQPDVNAVEERTLRGGYIQSMYRVVTAGQMLQPFVRAQYYRGGRKTDLDARGYLIREYDLGLEWLPMPALELTAQYSISDRRVADGSIAGYERQEGNLLRLQAQINY